MSDFKTVSFKKLISVCGLDCSLCKVYMAGYNPRLAYRLSRSFTNMWDNVKPEDFHCSTCRGEISKCWTKECWIRNCCVNEKKLDFCYKCKDFPCKGLLERSSKNKRYKTALKNLMKMKKRESK